MQAAWVRVAAVAALCLLAALLLLAASSRAYVEEAPAVPATAAAQRRLEARAAAARALADAGARQAAAQACAALEQRAQLLDATCTALWVHRLRHAPIASVQRMWGFEHTHWGAITLDLGDGMLAQFKPCSTMEEDVARELVGFHLDQALQWGQFAPVAYRRIAAAELLALLDDADDLASLALTVERCGLEGGILEGPMIGWWDGLTMVRTVKKSKTAVEALYRKRGQLAENLYTAQQMSKFHAFYWLVQILRHGKDEFVTPEGHLVALDLDRSRYGRQATRPPTSAAVNFTWCYTCLMAREAYDSFAELGPGAPPALRLSAVLERSMALDDSASVPIYERRMGERLDERVAMLLACMEDCFALFGRENVLLDEPPSLAGADLVQWYRTGPKGL